MLENIQTSISQLRKEDLSLENVLAVCNNIILELKNNQLEVQQINELRKQLNLMMYFVNETYNNHSDQLSRLPASHLLEKKKQELEEIMKELKESQGIVDETNRVVGYLMKEKDELEKVHQRYLRLMKEKEQLEKTIKQYQEIDKPALKTTIETLEKQNNSLQKEKQHLFNSKETLTKQQTQLKNNIDAIKLDNKKLNENIKTLQKNLNAINTEYDMNIQKRDNITKEIDTMKSKLASMETIPQKILDQYNAFEQELKRKRTQLKCLLDNNKELEKQIFNSVNQEEAIGKRLKDLEKESELLFDKYRKLQKIGITMKEGKL